MGYQHFMIGDDICFDENTLLLGLDILHAIGVDYEKYQNKHPKASPALSPA
jgi:hypothetical protein